MSRHPEILAEAQNELDTVIGPSRMPSIDDLPNLPYIEAIMTELLRFAPPTRSGFPHKTTADDVYNGYFIAKGTMVIPNTWCVLDKTRVLCH
jgi:cytochrome P450